jgi:hypothetical protein
MAKAEWCDLSYAHGRHWSKVEQEWCEGQGTKPPKKAASQKVALPEGYEPSFGLLSSERQIGNTDEAVEFQNKAKDCAGTAFALMQDPNYLSMVQAERWTALGHLYLSLAAAEPMIQVTE